MPTQQQAPHEVALINEINQNVSLDLSKAASLIFRAFSALESTSN